MDIKKITILILLVVSILIFLGIDASALPPERPADIKYTTGNFWINFTWSAGANTDSFNVSIDGNWTNGTKYTFINTTSIPHGTEYIAVAGYNETSKKLSEFNYSKAVIPNNQITLTNVTGSYVLYEGETLYIDAGYFDLDNDTGIFTSTAINDSFDPSTGIILWKTRAGDGERNGKIYTGSIKVTDGNGSSFTPTSSSQEFKVTVYTNIPGDPVGLKRFMGNFWVNYTWSAGANTDSFNLSVNGSWDNGSRNIFKNVTGLPHGWINLSVAGYNAASQLLSNFVSMSTQIQNNPITITNVNDRYLLNEGDTLYIDADYYDLDEDEGIFTTDASKGIFNSTTGLFSWTTAAGDGGVYIWHMTVTDGYGSISTKEFKVIIPPRVSINFIEPGIINNKEEWNKAYIGHIGKFIGVEIIFNNTGEAMQFLNITEIYNNTITNLPQLMLEKGSTFSYRKEFEINSSGVNNGFFSYTFKVKSEGYDGGYTFFYENTTIVSLPIIPIFKIKRASHDLIYVRQGSSTPPITYTLEANSSINILNVSIYDPFYPANQGGPYFNISKLEANRPKNISYTYQATTADSNKNNCGKPYNSCILNLATFTGKNELTGEWVNDTDYVRIPVATISSDTSSSSRSRNTGGGGGGGGNPPSEDFKNIEKREVREMSTLAGLASAYIFKYSDPIVVVSFQSSVSENEVPVVVEVLKNRSKKIDVDPPANLYKYFNVFVGMSGFSKKVSNGVIVYRINNSWLEENGLKPKDIYLFKWDGDNWVKKNTEIVESKINQTYFASAVGNFSSYAIGGVKEEKNEIEVVPVSTPSNGSQNYTTLSNVKQPQDLNIIIGGVLIIGILGLMYYTRIKNKK